jgi:hypothetical protein
MIATKLDAFTRAYIECALWSSTDDDGEPLDSAYSADDIAPDALREMIEDCRAFQADQSADLADIDSAQAGHDFWLTRNRHGAGFWDRGLGGIGQRLTDAAHVWGSVDLYLGDDGRIYL